MESVGEGEFGRKVLRPTPSDEITGSSPSSEGRGE